MTPAAGTPLPDFSLPLDDGSTLTPASLSGRTTVLYFYPKDDTSGCTSEAKAFRDALPAFTEAGVAVFGVSVDPIASHIKFRTKHALNFPLASDTEKSLATALGLWVEKSMYGRKYMGMERATLLIDGTGVIRYVWRKVKVAGHVAEVLQVARELAAQQTASA